MRQKVLHKQLLVPLLFTLIFGILLIGQYASKSGALLLDQGDQWLAFLYIGIGYCCLVSRGFIWIVLLKYVNLSVAYPIQSFSFVLIMFLGVYAFNEHLTGTKIVGICCILLGILLITKSKR